MDCEMPMRYADYPAYYECQQQRGISDELRDLLLERCVTEDQKVQVNEIQVSSGTYRVMVSCSHVLSVDDVPAQKKEADE